MNLIIIVLLALIAAETTYLSYKSFPKTRIAERSVLIDTSVLIDGRILPIARSSLITAPLVIPRSVIRELQYMADKADHEKRERAREGLDMIDQLQRIDGLTVSVIDDKSEESGVDERLVELAQAHHARLCTVDYNLNKSARAQGVDVININEIAHALRIVHLPGEIITLKLVQAGQEARQAVGYLDDGTMVVVDDAKALIHQDVQAEITRALQTSAGRMMFAKLLSKKQALQTRGDGEAGSRMVSQKQRGDGEAGSRMVSQKQRGDGEDRISRPKPPRHAAGNDDRTSKYEENPNGFVGSLQSREGLMQKDADADTPEGTSVQKPKQRRKNYRRRTPEDKLVDLANNE